MSNDFEMQPLPPDSLVMALADAATAVDIPTPNVIKRRVMTVDVPVRQMRIGDRYGKHGIVKDILPLGRHDRTHVEVVVKYPASKKRGAESVQHFRHEMIGTFETVI